MQDYDKNDSSLLMDKAAAFLQRSLPRTDMLAALLEAKSRSDRRDYRGKSDVLRRLLKEAPEGEFIADSDDGRTVGFTHKPTRFKIHLPKTETTGLPVALLRTLRGGGAFYRPSQDMPTVKEASAPVAEGDVKAALEEILDEHGGRLLLLLHKTADLRVELQKKADSVGVLGDSVRAEYSLWYGYDNGDKGSHKKSGSGYYSHVRSANAKPSALCLCVPSADPSLGEKEEDGVRVLPGVFCPPGLFNERWTLLCKSAFSPLARGITDAAALTKGPANAWYGGPRPLASMLAGGLLAGSAGWLGGAVAEGLLPAGVVRRGGLKRLLGLGGAALGALPGTAWGLHNLHTSSGEKGFLSPEISPASSADLGLKTGADASVFYLCDCLRKLLPGCAPDFEFLPPEPIEKRSYAGGGFEAGGVTEPISVDAFGRVVWSKDDPYTPSVLRAAAMGLVDAAGMSRGGASPWVSPADIARVAVGMGSGAASGWAVGKTLGMLAGLTPESQSALQRAGTWAGLLQAVVPAAFPAPYGRSGWY